MKKITLIKWIAYAVIGISVLLLMRALPMQGLSESLKEWIESLGVFGPVIFALIYIVAAVCLVPGSILTLLAGAVFGLGIGFITVSVASVGAAACSFLIARYVARAKVESVAKSNKKFAAIDEAISEGGWKVVGLLRLSPAIPFNLQNYLFGLTDIKFWPYVLTSWIAMMPGTFMYVYLGFAAGSATAGEGRSPAEWAMLVVGLLATIGVTVYVTKLSQSKLQKQSDLDEAENSEEASSEEAKSSAVKNPADGESDEPETVGSSRKTYALAGFAAVLFGLSILAQWQKPAIADMIGVDATVKQSVTDQATPSSSDQTSN